MKTTLEMNKREIIREIIANVPTETEKHLSHLTLKVLRSQLFNYRRYNGEMWRAEK